MECLSEQFINKLMLNMKQNEQSKTSRNMVVEIKFHSFSVLGGETK